MGNLPLKKDSRFKQGFYAPKNPSKYIGKLDNIIYRSGLELKLFRWADNNVNVLEWNSEEFAIPYFDSLQRKNRKYFIDAYVKIKEGDKIKIAEFYNKAMNAVCMLSFFITGFLYVVAEPKLTITLAKSKRYPGTTRLPNARLLASAIEPIELAPYWICCA